MRHCEPNSFFQMYYRCFAATPKSLSQEELDMLTAGIEMFNNACNDSGMYFIFLHILCIKYLAYLTKGHVSFGHISCVHHSLSVHRKSSTHSSIIIIIVNISHFGQEWCLWDHVKTKSCFLLDPYKVSNFSVVSEGEQITYLWEDDVCFLPS